MIMNSEQAKAYAQLALLTIQNTANGDYSINDLNVYDFADEMEIMFELYPLETAEASVKRILMKKR